MDLYLQYYDLFSLNPNYSTWLIHIHSQCTIDYIWGVKNKEDENKIKRCTGCGNEYSATSEYFHKMKNGKYGLRSACKECIKMWRKKYTSTEEYKKKHRENMSAWRAKKPEKALEASRKNYKLHGKEQNSKKRYKYKKLCQRYG